MAKREGGNVSVTVANLVMEDVEKRAGNGRSTIQVLERYVDDTCTVLVWFLDHLNNTQSLMMS